MKHYLSVLLAVVTLLVFTPQRARANDYMEHTENYTVYASGIDKIHFSIPVWVHGAWYERSYSALPGSHFAYKVGTDEEVTVLNWLAHVVRDNDKDNDKVYDINGVQKKSVGKGINIVKGKKIAVK